MAEIVYKNGNTEIRLEQTHSIENQGQSFFHSNEFINRRKDSTPLFFNLFEAGKPLASIAFEIVYQQAISLPRSPFGGFIIGENIDSDQMGNFLTVIIEYFQKQKLSIQIKLAPAIYLPLQKVIHDALVNKGFSTQYRDLNQHISIDQLPFSTKINRNRRRKLDLNISHEYVFKMLDVNMLNKTYDLITECREEKEYPVTMTLQELLAAFTSFPDQYFLFGLFDQDEMIATAVSIKVNDHVLYNFYHGDRLSHRQNSPVALLVGGIYGYCQEQSIEILDLGISTDRGVINEGLYYFKESCGAIPSDKISYHLNV